MSRHYEPEVLKFLDNQSHCDASSGDHECQPTFMSVHPIFQAQCSYATGKTGFICAVGDELAETN